MGKRKMHEGVKGNKRGMDTVLGETEPSQIGQVRKAKGKRIPFPGLSHVWYLVLRSGPMLT